MGKSGALVLAIFSISFSAKKLFAEPVAEPAKAQQMLISILNAQNEKLNQIEAEDATVIAKNKNQTQAYLQIVQSALENLGSAQTTIEADTKNKIKALDELSSIRVSMLDKLYPHLEILQKSPFSEVSVRATNLMLRYQSLRAGLPEDPTKVELPVKSTAQEKQLIAKSQKALATFGVCPAPGQMASQIQKLKQELEEGIRLKADLQGRYKKASNEIDSFPTIAEELKNKDVLLKLQVAADKYSTQIDDLNQQKKASQEKLAKAIDQLSPKIRPLLKNAVMPKVADAEIDARNIEVAAGYISFLNSLEKQWVQLSADREGKNRVPFRLSQTPKYPFIATGSIVTFVSDMFSHIALEGVFGMDVKIMPFDAARVEEIEKLILDPKNQPQINEIQKIYSDLATNYKSTSELEMAKSQSLIRIGDLRSYRGREPNIDDNVVKEYLKDYSQNKAAKTKLKNDLGLELKKAEADLSFKKEKIESLNTCYSEYANAEETLSHVDPQQPKDQDLDKANEHLERYKSLSETTP